MARFFDGQTGEGGPGPQLQAALLGADPGMRPEELHRVDKERLSYAQETLKEYKGGKANLE